MDELSALEERCMRIVAAADARAKESRRELEEEVAALRLELAEKEETYQLHMEQVDANMRLHYRNLQEISNQFISAHRESTELIQSTAVAREEVETRALAHLKQTMHHFVDYWAWKRSRDQRLSVLSFAKHFTQPSQLLIAKLKTSSLSDIRQAVRGSYADLARAEHGQLEDANNTIDDDIVQKQFSNVDDVPDVSAVIDDLIDKSGHVGRAGAALLLPYAGHGAASVSGAAHAVVLYLLGAADVLDRFGDKVSGCVVSFVDAVDQARRAVLLKEEREILKQHAQSVMGIAHVEVSLTPVQLLLAQKIVSGAADRMTAVTRLLQSEFRASNESLSDTVRTARQELWDAVVPSLVDGLFLNESQFRSQLISRGGGRDAANRHVDSTASISAAPSPPIVVSALYRASASSSGLVDKIMIHVHEEQQKTLRRVHTEMALQMDKVVKTANTQRNIVVEQHTAEMRIDDIRADIRHQQFMRSLTIERESKLSAKLERETTEHRVELDHLRVALEKLQHENEVLKQQCAMTEAEATLLRELASHRHRNTSTLTIVQEETKMVNYAVNQGTFGETWQESLLRLRERILGELSSDNARFLAKLRSFLKRKEVDHAQIEDMYEARLRATVAQLNAEHATQVEWVRKHSAIEILSLRDEHATIVAAMKDEWARDKAVMQKQFEDSYLSRVAALNDSYAMRLRQLSGREREWEDKLAVAQRRLREQFRMRENELEGKVNERLAEMRRVFDDDSHRVKEQFAERHKELERSHLQATAKLDAQLNERSHAMQKKFEILSTRLQEDVLRFVGEKQSFFDTFRAKELDLMASFMHKKESMTAARYEHILETQRRRDSEEISALKTSHEKSVAAERELHAVASRNADDMLMKRLAEKSSTMDNTFHVAQQIQVKNDEAYWERCRTYLIEGEGALVERRAGVEVEATRRYQKLVDQCQTFLSRDIADARESLSREISLRYDSMHESCKPLQRCMTQLQYDLWEEHHRRSFMEGQEAAERSYVFSMCEESHVFLKRRAYFAELSETNHNPLAQVTLEDVRALREKFDQRLAEEHSYVTNLTRDTMSTLEVGLEASHNAAVQFQHAQREQLSDVCRLLQQKHEAFSYQRSKFVQDKCSSLLNVFSSHQQPASRDTPRFGPSTAGEHDALRVSREFGDTVAACAKQWETNLNAMESAARKRQWDAFKSMHEEYVATTTALMTKLEAAQSDLYVQTQRNIAIEAVASTQATELKHTLQIAKLSSIPVPQSASVNQIEAARLAATSRETMHTLDVWNQA